jgi:hypothetical protein
MSKFIFNTTGLVPIVKFEELGAYFNHPISAYTLSDYFTIEEIRYSTTIQDAITNGEIIAFDEHNNTISNITYLTEPIPIFDIDNVSNNKSYIGYGEINACKINEITTYIDGSYTSLWADGNHNFNKIWSDRLLYVYF